jgi:hypothetical protein
LEPTPGLEPGTPSLRGKERVSRRVRRRVIEGAKVLHGARIAEDCSGQEMPPTARAVYVVSTSRTTKRT